MKLVTGTNSFFMYCIKESLASLSAIKLSAICLESTLMRVVSVVSESLAGGVGRLGSSPMIVAPSGRPPIASPAIGAPSGRPIAAPAGLPDS